MATTFGIVTPKTKRYQVIKQMTFGSSEPFFTIRVGDFVNAERYEDPGQYPAYRYKFRHNNANGITYNFTPTYISEGPGSVIRLLQAELHSDTGGITQGIDRNKIFKTTAASLMYWSNGSALSANSDYVMPNQTVVGRVYSMQFVTLPATQFGATPTTSTANFVRVDGFNGSPVKKPYYLKVSDLIQVYQHAKQPTAVMRHDNGSESVVPAAGTFSTPAKEHGIFEKVGGVVGVCYGLYYAYTREGNASVSGKTLSVDLGHAITYVWWGLIFGLAFHEIGEHADRAIFKFKNQ